MENKLMAGFRFIGKRPNDDVSDEWLNFYRFMQYKLPESSKFDHEEICGCDIWRGTVWVTPTDVLRTRHDIYIDFKGEEKIRMHISRENLRMVLSSDSWAGFPPEDIKDESVKYFVNAIADIFKVERFYEED